MSGQHPVPPPAPGSGHHHASQTCPICGSAAERQVIGGKSRWVCSEGGYAHYYQAHYGHLKRWFTSGEGNLREPVIRAIKGAA
jgi:hypothetical protein